jgi:hypothetical protein
MIQTRRWCPLGVKHTAMSSSGEMQRQMVQTPFVFWLLTVVHIATKHSPRNRIGKRHSGESTMTSCRRSSQSMIQTCCSGCLQESTQTCTRQKVDDSVRERRRTLKTSLPVQTSNLGQSSLHFLRRQISCIDKYHVRLVSIDSLAEFTDIEE